MMNNADMPAMPTLTYDHGAAMQGLAVSVTDAQGMTKREMMAMHMMAHLMMSERLCSYEEQAGYSIKATDALLAELGRTK